MEKPNHFFLLSAVLLLGMPLSSQAKGPSSSGALTLLQAPGARPAAMGEAFSAASNDITAFAYNPASLKSLKGGHASYLYQRGLADDFYSQFMVGSPLKKGSWGLSVGYYNGGTVELFDGVSTRNVTAKRDTLLSLGYANSFENMEWGLTGKYFSSELGETAKASAMAMDAGLSVPFNPQLRLAGSVQNLGTQLQFVQEKTPLPRIARAGLAWTTLSSRYPTTLMFETPYYLNENEIHYSMGAEVQMGPLAIRAGYKTGSSLEGFSIGTGFFLGKASFDYSLGLVKDLDASHRVSLNMRFGNTAAPMDLAKKEKEDSEKKLLTGHEAQPIVYEIRPGDTLEKIALRIYGDSQLWTRIFYANTHLLNTISVDDMVGKKIVIP